MRHPPQRRPPAPRPGLGAHAVPVGTVIAYAGQIGAGDSSAGQVSKADLQAMGWMLCDGSVLARVDYKELYASIGTLYGSADDDTFRIPKLAGLFLRGADPDAAVDLDAVTRKPLGSGPPADVASHQDDALRDHVHLPAPNGMPKPQGVLAKPEAVSPSGPSAIGPMRGNVNISAHETRPANVSMHYLIRTSNRQPSW